MPLRTRRPRFGQAPHECGARAGHAPSLQPRRAALIAAIVAVGVTIPAGVSVADAAVLAPGVMGGGALLPGDDDGSGNMLITLRVTPDHRVRIHVSQQVSCPGGDGIYVDVVLSPVAIVTPDGAFRATGTRVERFGSTELRTVYDIAGVFTASGAAGVATVSLHDNDPVFPTCGSPNVTPAPVAWQARRPADTGAPGAIGGGLRYGITSRGVRGARGAIILRVSPDGKTLERVLHHSLLRCTRRVATPSLSLNDDPWVERGPVPIRSNGSFSERVNLAARFGPVISRLSTRFAGSIGALGARGTYRHDARFVNPRTGRTRERCTTEGTLRWSASP